MIKKRARFVTQAMRPWPGKKHDAERARRQIEIHERRRS
jgi:hypothetical protein